VEKRLEQIAMRLQESLDQLNREEDARCPFSWKRQLAISFMSGLARGMGMAVGFTLLGAILVVILQRLGRLNLPVIGGFLAEVTRIVLERL